MSVEFNPDEVAPFTPAQTADAIANPKSVTGTAPFASRGAYVKTVSFLLSLLNFRGYPLFLHISSSLIM